MIPLLIDENVPQMSIKWLMERGHDLISVSAIRPTARDIEIARWSAESNRIIVTLDRDFSQLIHHRTRPYPAGLIFLRIDNPRPAEVAELVDQIVVSFGERLYGRVTTASRNNVRHQLLPTNESSH